MPVRKLRCLNKCVFTRVVYFLFLFIYFAPLRSLEDLFIYLIETEHQKHHCRLLQINIGICTNNSASHHAR